LQVKVLRRTGGKSRRNLSPVRSDDYTAVIVVILTEDLRVEKAIRVPQPVVSELFKVRSHVNGRVITVTRRLLEHPAVTSFELSDSLLDAPIEVHECSSRPAGPEKRDRPDLIGGQDGPAQYR
jgi:hypothetical protein